MPPIAFWFLIAPVPGQCILVTFSGLLSLDECLWLDPPWFNKLFSLALDNGAPALLLPTRKCVDHLRIVKIQNIG